MKRAVPGHTRLAAVRLAPDALQARCRCGWTETVRWRREAQATYATHLDLAWRTEHPRCPGCGTEVPRVEGRTNHRCGSCTTAAVRQYAARYPAVYAAAKRDSHLRKQYGLSLAALADLIAGQGGVCAICGDDLTDRTPHVDHDHATGLVRGVLCPPCNMGLGSFRDDPDRMLAALFYLLLHGVSTDDSRYVLGGTR